MQATIDISRSLEIPGWMQEGELRWLAERASENSLIAEIGCWNGRSTVALAQHCPGVVHAVDWFYGSSDYNPQMIDGRAKGRDWIMGEFLKNTAGLSNIVVHPVASILAAAELAKSGILFDMIFIDASHDVVSVEMDIRSWSPLLREGGLLCGHDHGERGVRAAIDNLCPGWESPVNTIWSIRR